MWFGVEVCTNLTVDLRFMESMLLKLFCSAALTSSESGCEPVLQVAGKLPLPTHPTNLELLP